MLHEGCARQQDFRSRSAADLRAALRSGSPKRQTSLKPQAGSATAAKFNSVIARKPDVFSPAAAKTQTSQTALSIF
jgi:hypothetical protein